MSDLFYIRFNADMQRMAEFNVPSPYQAPVRYALAHYLKQALKPVITKKKHLFDELVLQHPIELKSGITLQKQSYAELIEKVNSFTSTASKNIDMLEHDFGKAPLEHIDTVVQFISGLPNECLNLFRPAIYYSGTQKIYPFSYLSCNGLVDYIVQLAVEPYRIMMACYRIKGHKQYLVIGGNFKDREFDTLVPYLFDHDINELNIKSLTLTHPELNFLADTYFGEFYTAKRQKRQIEDALTRFGYTHSFAKLAPLFPASSFNIVNFEAVFNTVDRSPLEGRKDFILGAKANETLLELKNRNFNAVAVANNHALDYGVPSFLYTKKSFEDAGMHVIGGGENQFESQRILELNYNGQKVAIFNGYWSKVNAYVDYEFYALHDRPGINILNGVLFEQIEHYKELNPNSLVICFCHWGLDFKPVHQYQKTLSRKLISCGVDLVLGHGPHTLQHVGKISNKPVIYSLGNGVFNSNGEFERHDALPYGFVARLDIATRQLKLYPFLANNLETFWQPRLVNSTEFRKIEAFYHNTSWMKPLQDDIGFHFTFKI